MTSAADKRARGGEPRSGSLTGSLTGSLVQSADIGVSGGALVVALALALAVPACAAPLAVDLSSSGSGGEGGSGGETVSSGAGGQGGTGSSGGGGSAPEPKIRGIGIHVPETLFVMDNVVCVARKDEPACCWGGSLGGQLGGGNAKASYWATPVEALGNDVEQIEPGQWFTCARTGKGEVYCWGYSYFGGLGVGDLGPAWDSVLVPTKLAGIEGAKGLSLGVGSCAWTEDGSLFCWGPNNKGQLGIGQVTDDPVLVPKKAVGLPKVLFAETRAAVSCALVEGGEVYCWGDNSAGKLAVSSSDAIVPSPLKVEVLGQGNVQLSVSDSHKCVRDGAGDVRCWGGTFGATPVKLEIPGPIESVKAMFGATCVLLGSGEVRCWGQNDVGQLGDGTLVNQSAISLAPVVLSDATALWADRSTACARKRDGSVVCWGLLPMNVEETFIFTPPAVIPEDFKCDGATVPPLSYDDGQVPCGIDCL